MPAPFHMLSGLGFTLVATEALAQSCRGRQKNNREEGEREGKREGRSHRRNNEPISELPSLGDGELMTGLTCKDIPANSKQALYMERVGRGTVLFLTVCFNAA